jgi:PAS domain S-box-containing protein
MIEKQQEPIPPQFMPGMIENLSSPLEHISQYAPGMIYQYRLYPDGRSCFPYCSDAIKDIWGFSPKDVMNDASICFSIVHPDDLEGLLKSIDESAKTLKDWQHEYRVIIPGKDERWLLGHSKPEKCEDGSILWSGFITDVSPRVKFEKKLIKSSRLYAVTAQINQMVIHSKNQDEVFYEACRIVMVEGKFLMAWIGLFDPDFEHLKPVTLYGFEEGYLNNMVEISTRNDLQEGHGPTGSAFREGKAIVSNDLDKDPSYKLWRAEALKRGYASSIALPIFFKGKVIGTLNIYSSTKDFFNESEVELLEKIALNISYAIDTIENEKQHRQAEEDLKKSEINYRTIFEEAPLGIASVDASNGKFLSMNSIFQKIIGRSENELKKLEWMKLAHPDDLPIILEYISKLNSKTIPSFKISKRFLRPDGSIVWVDLSFVPLKNGGDSKHKNMCMIEDITERKINEEKLKKSEEMFSAIANLSPDIISILNKNGELLFNTTATQRIHGYPHEDLIGRNIRDLIHPEDRERVMFEFQNLLKTPGRYVSIQYRSLNKDGSYAWMEANVVNQLENPLIGGIITISRDINQRKKMEDELRTALATRDEFLIIASHELKTPITSLKLQLQMLNRRMRPSENVLPDSSIIYNSLASSIKQVDRITELVENLLDVARIQAGRLFINIEKFNLSEIVNDLIERFRELFVEAKCPLQLYIDPNIEGGWDRIRIEQVFVNIFSNAIKYAPGKPISISLVRNSNRVKFIVKDQGPGIPPEKQFKIFERFERAISSRNISGLGIGLFISKQIVEAHKGSILVDSKLGEGSTFTVDLPIA